MVNGIGAAIAIDKAIYTDAKPTTTGTAGRLFLLSEFD